MKIFNTYTLGLVLILLGTTLTAQEQLGLRIDNYAGVNRLQLNPAFGALAPLKWDVNLGAGAINFDNNYAYLANTSLLGLAKTGFSGSFELGEEVRRDGSNMSADHLVEFYGGRSLRYINVNASVDGPGAMFRFKNHAVGFYTKARFMYSTQNIPTTFSYYAYTNIPMDRGFSVLPFKGAAMAWGEVALHYSLRIPVFEGSFSLGVNAKYLQGYEAGFFRNTERFRFTIASAESVEIDQANVDFGFTNGNITGDPSQLTPTVNGTGFGFDLGAVYSVEEPDGSYRYRFGFALVDIGSINFTNNAEYHQVASDSMFTISEEVFDGLVSIEQLHEGIDRFAERALGPGATTLAGNSFRTWLPAAFTLYADAYVLDNVFLNATWMQRIIMNGPAIERNNILALSPRFEHRWLTASVSGTLYNWRYFRTGAFVRLGFITLGADNLTGAFMPGDLSGVDFYFAVKVNPFSMKDTSARGGKRRKVNCFKFRK